MFSLFAYLPENQSIETSPKFVNEFNSNVEPLKNQIYIDSVEDIVTSLQALLDVVIKYAAKAKNANKIMYAQISYKNENHTVSFINSVMNMLTTLNYKGMRYRYRIISQPDHVYDGCYCNSICVFVSRTFI